MQINENRYQRWFKQLLTTDTQQHNLALFEFLDHPALLVGQIATQNLGKDFANDLKMTIAPEQQAFVQWVIANVSLAEALAVNEVLNSAKNRVSNEGAYFSNPELPKDTNNWQWRAAARAVGNFWTDQVIDYWFERIQESDREMRTKLAHRYADDTLNQSFRDKIEHNFLQIAERKFPNKLQRAAYIQGVISSDPIESAEMILEAVYPPLKKSDKRHVNVAVIKNWATGNFVEAVASACSAEAHGSVLSRHVRPLSTVIADTPGISLTTVRAMGLTRIRSQ